MMGMTQGSRKSLQIVAAAAALGVGGNLLLRQTPWGLNAFLFVTVFVTALWLLSKKHRPELLSGSRIALMAAMLFLASVFVWRDSAELGVYNTLTILIIMGVLLLGPLGINARVAGAFHYACGFVWSGLVSLIGPFVLIGADIDWKAMPGTSSSRRLFSVLRGVAVALPLLLIFGALFSSADARFESLANRFINFDLATVMSHVFLSSVLAWLSAGYLRASMATPDFARGSYASGGHGSKPSADGGRGSGNRQTSYFDQAAADDTEIFGLPDNASVLEHINRSDAPDAVTPTVEVAKRKLDLQNIDNSILPPVFTLGTVETVIILGLVDLMFLVFVAIQVPYLFGGIELVQNTPDFKLAEYARRGFGELIAVTALVLPMLLISHWLLKSGNKRVETIHRVLAAIQILLVFVIMASAVQRLVLLTGAAGYGMTTVRFYPLVFMIWLALVFGWFGLTVLRGSRHNFAWGALWSLIAVLGVTNVINPDAVIAKSNAALMEQGRPFDAWYNAGELSADAVPIVFAALPGMTPDEQCNAKRALTRQLHELEESTGARSFNLSRSRALGLLRAGESELSDMSGCVNAAIPRPPIE